MVERLDFRAFCLSRRSKTLMSNSGRRFIVSVHIKVQRLGVHRLWATAATNSLEHGKTLQKYRIG